MRTPTAGQDHMVKQICIEGAQSLVPGDKTFLFLFRRIGSSIDLIPAYERPCPCSLLPGAVDAIVGLSVDRPVGLRFFVLFDL